MDELLLVLYIYERASEKGPFTGFENLELIEELWQVFYGYKSFYSLLVYKQSSMDHRAIRGPVLIKQILHVIYEKRIWYRYPLQEEL